MTGSVAVVGGGQAGATVSHALRQRGFDGEILLLTADDELPYERPPLSKGILRGEEAVRVLPASFYDENKIDLRLRAAATRVDRGQRQLEVGLESGEMIVADVVVLATGSRPRRLQFPGSGLDNVLTLGSLRDARRIRALLPDLEHVVIAGAGFVGTEVAAAIRSEGCEVTVVEPVANPLQSKIGPWASAFIKDLHEARGVRFVQDSVAAAVGSSSVESVVTAQGETLRCQLLLIAVGSEPNLEVALASGIDSSDGIVCDASGRTSMAGVWAAGDIASWPFGPLGMLRVEHYRTAIDQAQVIARAVSGNDLPEKLVPWFWTDQYDRRIEVAGRPDQGTLAIERTGPDGRTRVTVHLRGDRVVGAIGLDSPREIRAASNLIRGGDEVDPSLIEDPSVDLRKVAVPA